MNMRASRYIDLNTIKGYISNDNSFMAFQTKCMDISNKFGSNYNVQHCWSSWLLLIKLQEGQYHFWIRGKYAFKPFLEGYSASKKNTMYRWSVRAIIIFFQLVSICLYTL